MNDIQIFNNEEFGAVRTTGTPEQPLFCLADVARVLGLKTSKLVQRLSDDVLSKYPISDSLGREQVTNFINEDGLYDVILDSRKPEAKRFRKWVTSEVLPSIRKHGAYMTQQTIEKALAEWKSHATLTLLAKQDLPTFGYNMIAPLKSWCWGSILFYPFKISRFS